MRCVIAPVLLLLRPISLMHRSLSDAHTHTHTHTYTHINATPLQPAKIAIEPDGSYVQVAEVRGLRHAVPLSACPLLLVSAAPARGSPPA